MSGARNLYEAYPSVKNRRAFDAMLDFRTDVAVPVQLFARCIISGDPHKLYSLLALVDQLLHIRLRHARIRPIRF